MVQSPSWEANWSAASQEIPRISRNPKVHYRTHKRPPPVSILGQPNPVHIHISHLLEIRSNIIRPSTPRSPQWSPSLRFYHPRNIGWGVLRAIPPRNGDSIPLKGTGFHFSPKCPYCLWGSATLLLTEDVPTPKLKQLGHEAEHSSPCKTEFKNSWSYFSTTSYVFVARIQTILRWLFTSYNKRVFMKQIFKFSNALCKAIKIRTNADRKWDRYGKIYCFEDDYNLSIPLPELLWIKKININQ